MEIIIIIACIIYLSIAAEKTAEKKVMRGGVRPAAPIPPKKEAK